MTTEKKMVTEQYVPMPDDPVYCWLETQVIADYKLIGARIVIPKKFTPKGAKKIIELKILPPTGRTQTPTFNYNKILRQIKEGIHNV